LQSRQKVHTLPYTLLAFPAELEKVLISLRKFRGFAMFLPALAGYASGLQRPEVPLQSPRQALIEMFTGGEDKFVRHLTIEVQKKVEELRRNSLNGELAPLQTLSLIQSAKNQKFDAFDYGPILFALHNNNTHERMEIHIDADNPHGDEDDLDLSVHSYRSGIEQPTPIGFGFRLSLKVQQGIWRVDAVTVSARLPVGDPRIFDKSWWSSDVVTSAMAAEKQPQSAGQSSQPETPRMSAFRAVRLVTLAEDQFAQRHPDAGYTCSMADLINVGHGLDNGEPYTFMSPEFRGGVYNGYRFSLNGCQGRPVKNFRISAEPINGRGSAYCSDDQHNLRSSEDGRASTCLGQGKVARR
jgi:hypothetical protein